MVPKMRPYIVQLAAPLSERLLVCSREGGGAVQGKWDIDPGHDLLVDTRDGKTTVVSTGNNPLRQSKWAH